MPELDLRGDAFIFHIVLYKDFHISYPKFVNKKFHTQVLDKNYQCFCRGQ